MFSHICVFIGERVLHGLWSQVPTLVSGPCLFDEGGPGGTPSPVTGPGLRSHVTGLAHGRGVPLSRVQTPPPQPPARTGYAVGMQEDFLVQNTLKLYIIYCYFVLPLLREAI